MGDKADVWQGTLALMVLKPLQTLGPLHGKRKSLSLNYGTLYPALLKPEREGAIAAEWGFRRTIARPGSTN
jgi:PadR family transcriptional regulator, regulatory protein PadR